jgi:hypothetical protein
LNVVNLIDNNAFPCAWQVVNELLGTQVNSTDDINTAINNIFANNDQVNLVIRSHPDISSIPGVPPSSSQRGAFHRTIAADFDNNGNLFLSGEIYLDEDYIGCTADFTRGLVMHEALHAYIGYQREALSESDFLRDFPLFASGSEEEEHEGMATLYTNNLFAILRGHNQQITDFMIDLMVWSGLQDTNAYNNWKNSMPYGPSLSPEDIQSSMNTFLNASSTDCGNGIPAGGNLGDYNFDTCN